ncbi:MAG: hypothetical protein QG671_3902 [Actinomycetota bacterium]|jgi:hypothetical protein|nr:hypothetical protein [Actinomycetota bacterium]
MTGIVALIVTVASWALAAMAVFALVDCIRRPTPAFPAIGRLTKPLWLAILVASPLLILWNPMSIFGIAGIVAASVYLADVRPRIRELTGT